MRGLTIARPIRVESVTLIGKEVIVDPTDNDEGLTAEMLSETSTIEYVNPGEGLDVLRARGRYQSGFTGERAEPSSCSGVRQWTDYRTFNNNCEAESRAPKAWRPRAARGLGDNLGTGLGRRERLVA
jgi:hypothetical protein